MKKVTTITPCHNGEKYIQKCWESLKNQTIGIENMECIFVDDYSEDGTWEMLLAMEKEYPENVLIIRLPDNRRQGGARNEALKYVSGEYFQFLDQDDWLELQALEVLYKLAKENETDLIQFDYYHPNGKGLNDNFCSENHLFDLTNMIERKDMLTSGMLVCAHHNYFYRRSLWEETGSYFPEHMVYEEPLFVYPMYFTARRILISTEGLYNMRAHSESSTETLLASCLKDHPKVQKMLLDFLRQMPEEYTRNYEKEIEFYFIWTYYVETIINAGCGGVLPLDVFLEMQRTVLENYPNYEENRYLMNLEPKVGRVLDTIREPVLTKSELENMTKELACEFFEQV